MICALLALRPISHITKKTLSYLHSTKIEQMTKTMVIFKRGAIFLCCIRCDPIPPQTSVQRLAHTRNVTTCCCCRQVVCWRTKRKVHVWVSLHHPSGFLPLPSESVPMDDVRAYADVITKFFRIHRFPIFFSYGAPLARGSSATNLHLYL